MPSAIIHQCITKIINKELKLNEDLFLLGSIAPDCWRHSQLHCDKNKSHFSIECLLNNEYIKKEDYYSFYEKYKNNLDNPFVIGYLTHLITDTYWRLHINPRYKLFKDGQDFIKKLDGTIFIGDTYSEKMFLYDNDIILGVNLAKHYQINKLNIFNDLSILNNPIEELDVSCLNNTIEYINNINFTKTSHENEIYDTKDICNDIEKCSKFILEELKKLKL